MFASGTSSSGTRWLYKSILCARAPLFIELTSTVNTVEFPGWRLETLDSFVDWVNSGRVLVRGLTHDGKIDVTEALKYNNDGDDKSHHHDDAGGGGHPIMMAPVEDMAKLNESTRLGSLNLPWYSTFNRDPVAHILARTLDLYIFSDVGAIADLRTECILTWQRLLCAPYNVVLYSPLIRAVIDRIGDQESLLCQFIFEWTAFTIRDDVWEQANLELLPSDVLSKLLRLTAHRANFGSGTEYGVADPNRDWCRYHGHENQEERDVCRAGRLHDWDVRLAVDQGPTRRPANQVLLPQSQNHTDHRLIFRSEDTNEELFQWQGDCTAIEQLSESQPTPAATPAGQA